MSGTRPPVLAPDRRRAAVATGRATGSVAEQVFVALMLAVGKLDGGRCACSASIRA
jgi:hypothetical protein